MERDSATATTRMNPEGIMPHETQRQILHDCPHLRQSDQLHRDGKEDGVGKRNGALAFNGTVLVWDGKSAGRGPQQWSHDNVNTLNTSERCTWKQDGSSTCTLPQLKHLQNFQKSFEYLVGAEVQIANKRMKKTFSIISLQGNFSTHQDHTEISPYSSYNGHHREHK